MTGGEQLGGGAYSPWISEPQIKENNLFGLVCRDNTVGVAIRYVQDCPGIESRCG